MIKTIQNHVARGNLKLGKDTAIFNIGPAKTCAADRLGLCKVSDICYAKKIENFRPHSLAYKLRQAKIWDQATFKQIAMAIGTKHRPGTIKYFRFNESGDFRNQSDVAKMRRVAKYLYDNYDIITYGYTARLDLELPSGLDYFVITLSGEYFQGFNSFMPVDKFTGVNLECGTNCRVCDYCKVNNSNVIEILKH